MLQIHSLPTNTHTYGHVFTDMHAHNKNTEGLALGSEPRRAGRHRSICTKLLDLSTGVGQTHENTTYINMMDNGRQNTGHFS